MDMPITFKNPVLPGFHPDPSVCRVGKDYYLVTSTFEYFPGVPVFHSNDLINWERIGYCLTRKSQLNLEGCFCSQGIFAPVIRYNNGIFYMITTNVSGGGNFYVTAKDPRGPWSEPVWVDKGSFDPSLLFDDDGKVYYTRRDFDVNGIVQAEIDITSGNLKSPLKLIAKGFCSWDIEGPHLYKINGIYYLMCAEGGTRYGHMETIARSASPWGPFEPCPHNPILTHRHISCSKIRHTGHAELVEDHCGNWWVFCLGTRHFSYDDRSILGRETFLMPVEWTEDGWPVVGSDGTVLEEVVSNKCLGVQKPLDRRYIDDFDSKDLASEWNFIRNPQDTNWSLQDRPGFLRLYCQKAGLMDNASPAFVGIRQQHFHFKAEAIMQFQPLVKGEEAGLAIIASNNYHYEMAVILENNERRIIVRKRVGDIEVICCNEAVPEGEILLTVEGSPEKYTFLYSAAGESRELASGLAKFLSTELAESFTGCYIGLYATGNGLQRGNFADFQRFEYHGVFEPDNNVDGPDSNC